MKKHPEPLQKLKGGCRQKKRSLEWSRLLFPLITVLSIAWFFCRVIPKPIRATYPCQQAAFPILSAFFIWLLGLKASLIAWLGPRRKSLARKLRVSLITSAAIFGVVFLAWIAVFVTRALAVWVPSEGPNAPMGTARGIHPGRVVWTHDPTVTTYSSGNYYYLDTYTSADVSQSMISKTIRKLTDQATDAAAWDALFRFYNTNHARGNVGYQPGEKIIIKINCNNYSSAGATHDNKIDATPQMVKALLRELVNVAGVDQTNITVYDSQRYIHWISNYCRTEFATVQFHDKGTTTWVSNVITFATNAVDSASRGLPDFVVNTTYLINLASLKRHCRVVDPANWVGGDGQTAITCCMKNNFGSSGSPSGMHTMIRDWNNGMNKYNALIDLNGSRHLEGKTMLYLIDGLFSGTQHNSNVYKWSMAPFNGNFPCSLFGSQDMVAIDSVALDFLNNEMGLMPNADNFLHEAARANNPPSGTVYAPDGTRLPSLGVHEHWNGPNTKQYSRNLSVSGTGIELVPIHSGSGITVAITNPTGGVVLNGTIPVPLQAVAVSGYTGIRNVDFYSGNTLIGTSSNAPFRFNWTNAPIGPCALTAVAFDTDGLSATSAVVNVTILNTALTVALANPTNGSVLGEGGTLLLQASATPIEAVQRVEFLRNGALIGASSNSPFDLVWSNLPAGCWALTAVGVDTGNVAVASSVVNVVVRNPRIAVAGSLYVDLRATNFSVASGIWSNVGALGSFTKYGAPAFTSNAAATGVPGVQFAGADAFIGPATVSDLDGSSDRSVEVWVFNPTLVNEEAMVAWSRRGGPNSYNFAMNYGTNLQYGAASQWGSAYDVGWTYATNIPAAGLWHHIVYTYDGATTCKVYVDGALRITKTLGGVLNSYATYPILIGASTNTVASPAYTYFFTGYINTVRVHGGVLSAADVATNYSAGPYVLSTPLLLGLQSFSDTNIVFSINTVPGRGYRVEYCDDLQSAAWTSLNAFQTATGSWMTAADVISNQPQRFYRAAVTP